jgi:hypothetical protein
MTHEDLVSMEAYVAGDRFDRFLASRQPFERQFIEDVLLRKSDFVRRAQAMLTENDQSRALESANWVRLNAHEVARQWLVIRRTYQHWLERHDTLGAVAVDHRNGDPTDNSIDNLELRRTP